MYKKFTIYFFLAITIITACKKENNSTTPDNLLYAKRGTDAGIYDQQGRYVILRGVNYNVLGDYWQANPAVATTKQYDENDFKLMASYGINCVRLLFSWSKLEPQKGQYNQAYIAQIKKAIEDAAKYNIYILLDMHQDAYGKYIATPSDVICNKPNKGWDGAPDWATITDSASTCSGTGARENAPAVVHAWQNFWSNKNGIQDACIKAWQVLVKETAKYDNVVGYDLINEPSLGYEALNTQVEKMSLFYRNTITAIRSTENEINSHNHIMFFEMSVTWNGQEIPFIPAPNFTEDDNVIFAPHHYFESISNLLTIEQGLDLLYSLSKLFQTNTFIGEFGFFNNPAQDVNKYKRFAAKEDANFSSSTWWQWAQAPGDPHGISWNGQQYDNTSLHLIELDVNGNYTGNKNEFYLNVLSRTRPNAIFGKPTKLISNPDDGTMQLNATASVEGTTTLWIPNRFGTPVITGTNVKSSDIKAIDGGYNVAVKVAGEYVINVTF